MNNHKSASRRLTDMYIMMVIITTASSISLSDRSANDQQAGDYVSPGSELRLKFLGDQGEKLQQLREMDNKRSAALLKAATSSAEMARGEYLKLLGEGKPKRASDGLLIAFCGSVSLLGRRSHQDIQYDPQLMTIGNIEAIANKIDPITVNDRHSVLDIPQLVTEIPSTGPTATERSSSEPDFDGLIRKLTGLSEELIGLVVTPAEKGSGHSQMEWAIHNDEQTYIKGILEAINQTLQIIKISCAPHQPPIEATKFNEFKRSNGLTVEEAHYWYLISSDDLELAQQLRTRDCSPKGIIPCVLRPIRKILFESTSLEYCCANAS